MFRRSIYRRTAQLSANVVEPLAIVQPLSLGVDDLPTVQKLFDLVPDYLWVKDEDGRFLLANKAVANDHGLPSAADLIGLTDYDLHAPEFASQFEQDELTVMTTGESMLAKEERIICTGGQRKWLSTTKVPWRNKAGEIAGVVCVARDITDRRNAELLREGQSQVLGFVARNAPLEASLQCLIQMISALIPDSMLGIQVVENDGQQTVYGSIGELPHRLVNRVAENAQLGSGIEIVEMAEAPDWEDCAKLAVERGNRYCWAVPIVFEETTLGIVSVMNRERLQPTAAEANMLHTASHLAGLAIERKREVDATVRMATHDMLTGLPNRTVLTEKLKLAIESSRSNGLLAAVVFIDLDRFKEVNDRYGHKAGDELLSTVADRLRAAVETHECAIRFAGDEFIVILSNLADESKIRDRVDAIQRLISEPMMIAGNEMAISGSVGVHVCSDAQNDGADNAVAKADEAMYRAKIVNRRGLFVRPV